ncbi:MAG TPA: general stress protein [Mycobacteriales bacterium]|nr:general stress protein [Mycobacteriales bacterium]
MTTSPESPSSPTAETSPVGSEASAVTIGSYDNYAAAQKAVDFLSDEGFPVQHSAIVGSDLHLVERVTGRVTVFRAALTGGVAGIWFGLLLGLILAIANDGDTGVLGVAILVGAVGGALYYAINHALTRGKRDFASRSEIAARIYDVTVAAGYAERAKTTLAKLTEAK